ncbi:Uncharacterised protein [Mycobacteroides abscessus subsp. bolletii]|uniref:hypothetical protein n=1 Tax=Mycobacteroides abscessus TaxID=36809 RepID=UPI000927B1E5|nr:hypothetical protein [Mycobacteroides abscessus]MDM2104824.1 hypothetical protein [Mycobacteroides abscessus]MDM2133656.1 hypothetical protein [Mycobacteroides abscessus]MDM2142612.1 hypothetical protein [Mycobacteroides abscessus]MDM2153782.1 hypothetical protein [Mycobacteroides abscessus]MDM2182815.1 hypothetical protein [Mycobacteroides abscessus]
MVKDIGGGIFALIDTLVEHWGAVQRDLVASGLHFNGIGASRGLEIEFGEFASFVTYAPRTSAIGEARGGGWARDEQLAARLLEATEMLLWTKTEDATKPVELQEYRPTPIMWPGRVLPEPETTDDGEKLTVDSYLHLVGIEADWGEGD